jgi:hypothetical protein
VALADGRLVLEGDAGIELTSGMMVVIDLML